MKIFRILLAIIKFPDEFLTKQLNKFDNLTKEYLIKGSIIFASIWFIPTILTGFIPEKYGLTSLFLGIGFVFCIHAFIMSYLLTRLEFTDSNAKPTIINHTFNDYHMFLEHLVNSMKVIHFDFDDKLEIIDELSQMTIIFNSTNLRIYVIQSIWMENFDYNIYEKYSNEIWNEIEKRVGRNIIKTPHINLLQFICVQRQNLEFKKIFKTYHVQDFKRCQIITGVSLGGRKAYVGQPSNIFGFKEYDLLKETFDKLCNNLFSN